MFHENQSYQDIKNLVEYRQRKVSKPLTEVLDEYYEMVKTHESYKSNPQDLTTNS